MTQTRQRIRAAALLFHANNGRLVGSSCPIVLSSSSTPTKAAATAPPMPMGSKGPFSESVVRSAPSSPPRHTDAILDVGHSRRASDEHCEVIVIVTFPLQCIIILSSSDK